ncbi:MAG: hypothetical protein JO087_09735 [Actinobacteria bacterium]|nr:hypothetical protein [Actinomycetota bacterium]
MAPARAGGRGIPIWDGMSVGTRVGVVAVGLAVILVALAAAGVFSSSPQQVTAGNVTATTTRPASRATSTTLLASPDTTLVGPPGVATPTTAVGAIGTISGSTSGGAAVASTGGRSTNGGSSSSSGSSSSPGGSSSGGQTPAPQPRPAPPTTAAPSGGCPSGKPQASISSFQHGSPDAVDFYPVDVSGVVRNTSSATIDLYSVNISYYDAQGELVDTGSADLNGSLGPGQTREWSTHEQIDGSSGEPTHAVARLRYDWTDSQYIRCST